MIPFLVNAAENPGRGRRVVFHGSFASKADAQAKERQVGGFIRPTMIGGKRRYMVLTRKAGPSRPRGAGGSGRETSPRRDTMARKRSRRRGGRARGRRRATSRRRNPGTYVMNRPRRRGRSRSRGRSVARRGRRRGFRRNPPFTARGILGRLGGALVNGGSVFGGQLAQNWGFTQVPTLLTTTDPADTTTPVLNGVLKDSILVLAGLVATSFLPGRWRAMGDYFVAGQVSASGARLVRGFAVEPLTRYLGEYQPLRFGAYVRGRGIQGTGQPYLSGARRRLSSYVRGSGVGGGGPNMAAMMPSYGMTAA